MRGVIIAGGSGTRLRPLTAVCNKQLLPVGGIPMIYHPICKLRDAEICDILIVTSPEAIGQVANGLGSGSDLDVRLTYRVQDRPGGIAQALAMAQSWAGTDPVVVLLGDNIYRDPLPELLRGWDGRGARFVVKEVPDPHRFGVLDPDSLGARIVEKPAVPPSKLAVVGVYAYDCRVWGAIESAVPSARGELEITDVNNWYLERGEATWVQMRGPWVDAGDLPNYAAACAMFA